MKSILNKMFLVVKFILFFISIAFTLYIMLFMYKRLGKSLIESLTIFIPYIILFVLYILNIYLDNKSVNNSLFYNLTSSFVFITSIVVSLRAIFDKQMVLNTIMGYNINFNYFSDYLTFMNVMLIGLIISNVLLMFHKEEKKK